MKTGVYQEENGNLCILAKRTEWVEQFDIYNDGYTKEYYILEYRYKTNNYFNVIRFDDINIVNFHLRNFKYLGKL